MTQQMPVKSGERETFMDVLRGFAILGIFIANLNAFSWYDMVKAGTDGPYLVPAYDNKVLFLHHLFIEGKFYSIFSFLFGWGIALQLNKSAIAGISPFSFIRRRLFVMLLLGAVHLMLWPGDIVFFYALLGFVLLPLSKLSNKTLIITGCSFLLLPIALYALKMNFPVLRYPTQLLYDTGAKADAALAGINSEEDFKALIHTTSWYKIFLADLSGFFFRYGDLFFQSRIFKVLGMMMLGLVVGRTGFYSKITQYRKLLYYIIAGGLIIGLPANYMLAHYMDLNDGAYYQYKMNGFYRTVSYAFGVAPLAAAYIALFMLAYKSASGSRILNVLAPAGKMAFTNYISQTLFGNFFFLYAGLGYMEKFGPVYYTLLALAFFSVQVIVSTIWLRYFHFGPLEWIWRSATYRKWQPMLKHNAANK